MIKVINYKQQIARKDYKYYDGVIKKNSSYYRGTATKDGKMISFLFTDPEMGATGILPLDMLEKEYVIDKEGRSIVINESSDKVNHIFDKDIFIDTIEFIKKRRNAEERLNKIFTEEFTDSIFYPYSRYETQLIKVLEEVFNDHENQWISYYIHEANFGELFDYVYEKDDIKKIPLKTSGDLYDLLMKGMEV